ncbi:MAG TPA: peptidoglycan-binding protein [Candidatus Acidoferrales bacterium]|jgi:hypothetical protein|nr:peptidoglycan-binding protein [Candidatus Acidoferrales bacterium]
MSANNILQRVIARLVSSSAAFNTLALPPPVPIHLQRSPDFPGGAARGIDGLDFHVVSGGSLIQIGKTGADGKIDVRVPAGGSSTVQLLFNGGVVAEYEVTRDDTALAAVNTVLGQQQRLRMLGYQIGHGPPDGNGVDGNVSLNFERSILDFQADQGIVLDGVVGSVTSGRLTTQAGI